MVAHNNQIFKVVIIGDSGVGKSCLLKQYMTGEFVSTYSSTIGVDFLVREKFVSNPKDDRLTRVKLQIWDTAGQERFRTVTYSYYRHADCILLVYDVTESDSFSNIERWLGEVRKYVSETMPIALVANKTDLTDRRVVSKLQGQQMATKHSLAYFETSSLDRQCLESMFDTLTTRMLARREEDEIKIMDVDKIRLHAGKSEKVSTSKCCYQ